MIFHDRREAGQKLAEKLSNILYPTSGIDKDIITINILNKSCTNLIQVK